MHVHFTFRNTGYVKGFQINTFMIRAPDDHSLDPLPTGNISMVVRLTQSCSEHLYVIHLTLCHPELVNGYFFNPLMVRAP